jgi:flavin-dependent dehydrogenase
MTPPEALVFQFQDSCRPGYRYVFPASDNTVNLGIWICAEKPGVNLHALGEELLRDYQARRHGKWRGGFTPLWSGRGKQWHHPSGVVSCGDAAGIVNPFNGEGMTAALLSGEKAGEAVADFITGSRRSLHLEKYSYWIREYFNRAYGFDNWQSWKDSSGIGI